MKEKIDALLKKTKESSILWMLYEWQGEWGSYKKLAHFTRIPINKCKHTLQAFASENIAYLAPTFKELKNGQIQQGIGYFLNPAVRNILDEHDSK